MATNDLSHIALGILNDPIPSKSEHTDCASMSPAPKLHCSNFSEPSSPQVLIPAKTKVCVHTRAVHFVSVLARDDVLLASIASGRPS